MKTIFITGASRGIGKATALHFAKNGFYVILATRKETDLLAVQQEIIDFGGKASYVICDVQQEESVQKAIDTAIKIVGKIDILVNNAGIGLFKAVENISVAEWEQVMDSNVKGTFLCCKTILPSMKLQKTGHIIVIASDVAKRTFANGTVYCASKFAQDAFAAALRKEVRHFGIKVTTIYPGLTDSYFNGNQQGSEKTKNWLQAQDIAEAIYYASNAPSQVLIDEIMLHPITQEY